MTSFTIIDKDGTETNYPALNFQKDIEQEIVINEPEPTKEDKKQFYTACLVMANTWFGIFAFCLPCLIYISEKKLFTVGGLFWSQACILYSYLVLLHTYKKLKHELK
jgi:hypothetical protein